MDPKVIKSLLKEAKEATFNKNFEHAVKLCKVNYTLSHAANCSMLGYERPHFCRQNNLVNGVKAVLTKIITVAVLNYYMDYITALIFLNCFSLFIILFSHFPTTTRI